MAQRNIDFGSFPDDPNADAIRTAFDKVQQNFTELFSGLQDQAVISVNRTTGTGITVNAPTGNVIVSANIAQVRIQSTTLDLSTGSNASPASLAVINSGTVPIFVNLPQSITGIANITLSGTLTAPTVNVGSQLNGSVANFTGNINSLGNITAGNVYSNLGTIGASSLTGTLTTNAQPNITSVGTLSTLSVSGNLISGNANLGNAARANFFIGDGTNLTNVAAIANTRILNGTSFANIPISGGNLNIVIAGNPTMNVTATGANITGTLDVTSNISAGNLVGRLANGGNSNITIISATGNVTTAVNGTTRITATNTGANITGTLGVSANANVGNLGTAQVLATTNITAPQLISNVAFGTAPLIVTSTTQVANLNVATAGTAGSATTAGTVTTNAQPNITSVGTLSSLVVTGNTTAGNVYANSGTVGASLLTGTLTTAAQPNITSLGTLTGLGVGGNITAANITANTGVFTGNGSGLTALNANNLSTGTVPSARLTGSYSISVTSATTAGTVTTAAQPNITSVGTLSSLVVTGNISAGNVSGTLLTGTLTTAAQPNITSIGTLGSLTVTNKVTAGQLQGEGGNISNIQGSNVSGAVASATSAITAGTVTTSSQPNITSVGTLSTLAVSGNVAAGNVSATSISGTTLSGTLTTAAQPNITSVGALSALSITGNLSSGNANLGNAARANFFVGDGSLLTNIAVGAGSFIENGNSEVRVDDSSAVRISVTGTPNVLVVTNAGANISGYANVIGNITAGNIAATSITGNLTTAAQTNITSLGTLTGLTVNGISNLGPNSNVKITGGVDNAFLKTDGSGNLIWDTATLVPAQGANTQVIFNDGGTTYAGDANLIFNKTTGVLSVGGNLSAGNISGANNITANFFTGTLRTNAQPNITSVGTLTSLSVTGNANAGNVGATNFVGSGASLTNLNAGNISTGTLSSDRLTGTYNISITGSAGSATTATSATTAGTVTTNAQPNITSVGTLSVLLVNGNISAANITVSAGTITSNLFSGNGFSLTNLNGSNVTGQVSFAATANAVAGANVSGQVSNALVAGTVYTNAQPNITSVGTLTTLGVNNTVIATAFTANTGIFTGNGSGITALNASNLSTGTVPSARLSGSYTINISGSATTSGTVTTAAQPNITSVGTLTSLNSSGTITAPAFTANTGVFTGNGAALTNLNASNVSSGTLAQARLANASVTLGSTALTLGSTTTTVAGLSSVTSTTFVGSLTGAATTAGTVTTAAQPNITSVGTLTSLTASGNISGANLITTNYVIRSVSTGISAAGTVQANATAITKELNVVSTVASGAGIRLPTAVAGMVITITNTSANTLNVYPATGAAINTLSVNTAFTHSAGATLQFMAPTTTQWYTVGATYA